MKSYVILLVALTMLVKPLWPIAEYIANYDYIVNVLCENKDKPQLNCDGKCYLAKQLAKENEQNGQNPFEQRQSKVELVQPMYFQSLVCFNLAIFFPFSTKESIDYTKTLFSSPHVLDLIRPPEAY